ncbi:molybdenum cofactor guanylyltransferase MobA [Roseibium sp.]|uniref:molybdenum cofactor guanylyltransferase MobA n=1 Tax=Roseibium sp. TaxID=1936156 RepID=UPI003A982413
MTSRAQLSPDHILACVLAGGQSRRMGGGDKTLLDIGSKPMLTYILERLRPQTNQIVLNANGDPERFTQYDLPVVSDTIDGFAGPLAGILAGLTYARTHCPDVTHVVSVAGDTPFFPQDLIARLTAPIPDKKPVIALATSHERLHPVFGLWPVELLDDLERWLASGKSGKVLAWVDRHDSIEVAFPDDPETGLDPFFNANRPEDLDVARSALEKASA